MNKQPQVYRVGDGGDGSLGGREDASNNADDDYGRQKRQKRPLEGASEMAIGP